MTVQDRLNDLPDLDDSLVYGVPQQTQDGSTVITAWRPGGRFRSGPRPVGVFTIHGGKTTFTPAVDATRIALMGELIGLVAVAFATGALLRRPPWPEMSFHRFSFDRPQPRSGQRRP